MTIFSFLTTYYVLSYCIGKTFQSLSNNNDDSFLDLEFKRFPNLFSLAGLFIDPQYLTYSDSLIVWHPRINRSLFVAILKQQALALPCRGHYSPIFKVLEGSHLTSSFIYNCGSFITVVSVK